MANQNQNSRYRAKNNVANFCTKQSEIDVLKQSWQQLQNQTDVQELAFVMSLFAPNPIPWWLLKSLYRRVKPEKCQVLNLARYKLIELNLLRQLKPETFEMQPLIRKFLHQQGEQFWQQEWKHKFSLLTVECAKEMLQTSTSEHGIKEMATIIPHLAETATTWQSYLNNEDLIWACLSLVYFYEEQGADTQAQKWWQECLSVKRTRFGEEQLDMASSLHHLGAIYEHIGQYQQAEQFYLQAWEKRRDSQGEEHPQTKKVWNNLVLLVYKAVTEGREQELSTHPLVQELIIETHRA